MARPKSTAAPKSKLNLSVSAQTRLDLAYISQHTGQSISSMISEWATKEARRIAKQTGTQPPDINQLTLEDITPPESQA